MTNENQKPAEPTKVEPTSPAPQQNQGDKPGSEKPQQK